MLCYWERRERYLRGRGGGKFFGVCRIGTHFVKRLFFSEEAKERLKYPAQKSVSLLCNILCEFYSTEDRNLDERACNFDGSTAIFFPI
jgi:hypothetical protein